MKRIGANFWIVVCAGLAFAPVGAARAADTGDVLNALVHVRAEVPSGARTAKFLGTERDGSGVVIDSHGLVVTIGYLILEAMSATVTDSSGNTVPADIVAYDYDTGFGLVRARAPLDAVPMRLGKSADVAAHARLLAISFGGPSGANGGVMAARVAARGEFAGYWEYLLERAIYTTPPHPEWSGAALIGAEGRLLGIGSLFLPDVTPGPKKKPGNMFVPIDLLKPILADMIAEGRPSGPAKPWLGMFTNESIHGVVVSIVVPESPAEVAGIRKGDRVLGVAGDEIDDMAGLFRAVWALGAAGVEVPLVIRSRGTTRTVIVRSVDRYDYLRLDPSY